MKRIILSILTVALAIGLVGGGAFAYFQDTEASNDNTFTAGILDLTIDCKTDITLSPQISPVIPEPGVDNPPRIFDSLPADKNLKPGDHGEVTISLHLKDNSINADMWMEVIDKTLPDNINGYINPESEIPGDDTISDDILTTVWIDINGDNELNGDETAILDGTKGDTLYDLFALGEFPVAYNVAGGETKYVGWKWEIPTSVGNQLQGDICTFDIEFGADQVTDYPLNMVVIGNGTVDPSVGIHSYPAGSIVNVYYSAGPGWTFSGWSINVVSDQVTMNGPQTVTATFIDITPPDVLLSSSDSGPTASNPIHFTATFSEDVTGFTEGDIAVGNGVVTVGSLSGGPQIYNFTVTPSVPDGTITVDIGAGATKDLAGNDNTAATQFSIYYDGSSPNVESITVSDPKIEEEDAGSSFNVVVTFSEKMNTSFVPAISFNPDVASSGTGTLTFNSGAWSVGDTVYTATYTVADVDEEETGVDISAAGAKDMIGNVITPNTEADLFDVDTIAVRELTVTGITAANKVYDGGISATLIGLGGAATDTSAIHPTAHSTGGVDNAGNTYDSDADWSNSYATWASSSDTADFTGFNIAIPAGATINNVTLSLTGNQRWDYIGGRQLLVSVSSDGTNFSSTEQTNFSASASTQNFDGTSSLWGMSWTADSFNNNNFKVRIGVIGSWNEDRLVNLTATVNYTPANTAALVGVEPGDAVTLVTSGAAGQFDTENVGNGKTVNVSGLTLGGSDAAKYVLIQPTTTANIVVLPITVTAATNTKPYDKTTSSTGVPTITSGSLASGDTAVWTQTFSTANAGTGKTLVPNGNVNDGNSGLNYAVSFVNNTTGVINRRPITVTAVTDTKTYDGTTSSTGVPTITSGSLASGDSATWTQTFNNENYGTTKTLTPAGTVNDGNGGNNYTVTLASATGAINKRPITVTAVTSTKTYDGTTSSTGVPTITSGTLASGDSATWTQAFNNENYGTGKTLTPAGTVSDGNSGNNYAVTFVTDTTGVINKRAITVTAVTNTKLYDGTTSAAAVPTITVGSLATGDSGVWTETYDNASVGTGKTLTPAGTVSDGNSGNNYAVSFVTNNSGVIIGTPTNIGQNSSISSGTTLAVTVPAGGVPAGSTVIVTYAMDPSTTTVGVADSQGNTYSKDADGSNGSGTTGVRTLVFSAPVTTALASGNTITVTTNSNVAARAVSVYYMGGLVSASRVDQTRTGTGTGASPSSGTRTTTQANELLVGAIGYQCRTSVNTMTAGTNYALLYNASAEASSSDASITIFPEYRIVSSIGTYSATGTLTGSNASSRLWAAAIVTYRIQ